MVTVGRALLIAIVAVVAGCAHLRAHEPATDVGCPAGFVAQWQGAYYACVPPPGDAASQAWSGGAE
jgi:hypothetical protein